MEEEGLGIIGFGAGDEFFVPELAGVAARLGVLAGKILVDLSNPLAPIFNGS